MDTLKLRTCLCVPGHKATPATELRDEMQVQNPLFLWRTPALQCMGHNPEPAVEQMGGLHVWRYPVPSSGGCCGAGALPMALVIVCHSLPSIAFVPASAGSRQG